MFKLRNIFVIMVAFGVVILFSQQIFAENIVKMENAVKAVSVDGEKSMKENIQEKAQEKMKEIVPQEVKDTVQQDMKKHEEHNMSALTKIDIQYVCMVNNKKFDKPQIPVEVNGKTYYGCCEMCKARLTASEELRQAVDPLSGKIVDKATAIAASDSHGQVYYFENEENMLLFNKQKSKSEK